MRLRTAGYLKQSPLITFHLMILWIAAGCEPDRSTNPFYKPQDVVYDAGLISTCYRPLSKCVSLSWTGGGEMSSLFTKEDDAAKEKGFARERRRRAIMAMSTEQLQNEVLGLHPKATPQ